MTNLTFRKTAATAARIVMMVSVLAWGSGCGLFGSDDDGDDDGDDGPDAPSSLVVANGGNFADQNGYLMLYDAETGVTVDLPDLGAFAHSVTLDGSKAYVSLNTFSTGRVDVVDLDAGQVVQQIHKFIRRYYYSNPDRCLSGILPALDSFGMVAKSP